MKFACLSPVNHLISFERFFVFRKKEDGKISYRGFGIFVALVLWSSPLWGSEKLGKIDIHRFVVNPTYTVKEPQTSGFSLRESTVGVRWRLDHKWRAQVRLGARNLVNQPQIFSDSLSNEFGLFEAYGEYQGAYGRWRAGLIPLEFGIEKGSSIVELDFLRPLYFRQAWVGLRDLGVSYKVENNGWFTRWAVHNGEGGGQQDGRVSVTASWGWRDNRNIEAGVSGQTGSAKPTALNNTKASLGELDPDVEAQWRTGLFYVNWHPNQWRVTLEYLAGEMEQSDQVTPYRAGHFSGSWQSEEGTRWMVRYNIVDPSTHQLDDRVEEIQYGWGWEVQQGVSTVYFLGTRVIEEEPINNDRWTLSWVLTPNI